MRSKRGGTLAVEEIVKLVIGIGVFIFILFILFALGKIVASNLKEEQAKNTLDNIVYEARKLDIGSTKEMLLEGPKGWTLMMKDKDLCFCEKLSKSLCSGISVCKNIGSYISTPCSLTGTFQASGGGLFCIYMDKVPLKIYFVKEADSRINIDSKELNLDDSSVDGSSIYRTSILSLSWDQSFLDLVQKYLSSKLDSDKQNLNDYINNLNFIKTANLNGIYWRLSYETRDGAQQYIFQDDKNLVSDLGSEVDLRASVSVGDLTYLLKMELIPVSATSISQTNTNSQKVEYAEVPNWNGDYRVSSEDCYGVFSEKYCILQKEYSASPTKLEYYFKASSFTKGTHSLFQRNIWKEDVLICNIVIGERTSITACPSVFRSGGEVDTFILNEDGTFTFQIKKIVKTVNS